MKAAEAAGPVSWGASAETANQAFANAATCEVAGKLKRCELGEPGTEARITPPPLCVLHLTHPESTCTAYIRGCTPGVREATFPAKRVFVTSGNIPGDMGGLAGADFYCDLSAENGGLSGSFRAWLSGSSQSPSRSTFLPALARTLGRE